MLRAFLTATFALILILLFTHLFVPIFAGTIILGTWALIWLIGSVVAFCIFIMAVFVAGPIILYVLVAFAGIWLVAALFMLPFMFPVLLPLFVVMLFLMYIRRRRRGSGNR
jgi:hypothetical protein